MRNQRGISLVTVIVTIIVIIILSAIVINESFKGTLENANFTRAVSEMTEVYDATLNRGIEHKIDASMYPYIGTRLSDENSVTINGTRYGEGYYYIETDAQRTALKLDKINGKYVVNYETGDVVSEVKLEYEGKDYYRLVDIANAMNSGGVSGAVGEYDEAEGVNKPILSDGMVPVKASGSKWVVTTADDSDWYDYGTGKYATIMLMDELTLESATNSQLRKMSRDELDALSGDEVIVQGSTFIWIPRYTYKEEVGGTKIVYSNLTKDYIDDGYIKSPAFYFGAYNGANSDVEPNGGYLGGGRELTGVWVSKYEAGFNQ